jgi:hypothetical protein
VATLWGPLWKSSVGRAFTAWRWAPRHGSDCPGFHGLGRTKGCDRLRPTELRCVQASCSKRWSRSARAPHSSRPARCSISTWRRQLATNPFYGCARRKLLCGAAPAHRTRTLPNCPLPGAVPAGPGGFLDRCARAGRSPWVGTVGPLTAADLPGLGRRERDARAVQGSPTCPSTAPTDNRAAAGYPCCAGDPCHRGGPVPPRGRSSQPHWRCCDGAC